MFVINKWSFVHWFSVGALVLMLGGCATTPAPITGAQRLTGQEGAVVLKLITNGAGSSDPAETLSSIALSRELLPGATASVADTVVLVRNRSVTHTTAVFSGMVAPGRYHIVRASGISGNTTYTFPMRALSSSFDVKPGEVSLLGTVLVQPLEGNRFVVGLVTPEAEMLETFEQLFPALAQQTRGKPIHGFEMTPEMTDRTRVALQFKRLTTAVNGLQVSDRGAVMLGGKMGKVLWLKAGERRWRDLNVDSWREVLSVRAYRDGLLVAGEEGLLRYSSDEGRSWLALTPPDKGLIAVAAPLPNGKVIALVRRDLNWSAYISEDVLVGSWRLLGVFPQERSINVGWQNAVPVSSGNHVGIMMANGEFMFADGETGAIKRSSAGSSMLGISAMPDGMLVMKATSLVSTTIVSRDGGLSWKDLNTSRFIRVITFADVNKAYAVGPIDPGITAGEFALMVSLDSGRTWSKSGTVPGGKAFEVRELVVDRTDGSLLAFLRSGAILRSTDEGKTWNRDL